MKAGVKTWSGQPGVFLEGFLLLNFGAFIAFSALGTALWTGVLVWIGYLLGNNFERVGDFIDPVTKLVLGVVIVVYVVRVMRHKGAPEKSARPEN